MGASALEEQITIRQSSDRIPPKLCGSIDGKFADNGFTCDVLVSERLSSESQYGPSLFEFLLAREKHLRPGGFVAPSRVKLMLDLADFSSTIDAYKQWQSSSAVGRIF